MYVTAIQIHCILSAASLPGTRGVRAMTPKLTMMLNPAATASRASRRGTSPSRSPGATATTLPAAARPSNAVLITMYAK